MPDDGDVTWGMFPHQPNIRKARRYFARGREFEKEHKKRRAASMYWMAYNYGVNDLKFQDECLASFGRAATTDHPVERKVRGWSIDFNRYSPIKKRKEIRT